MLIISIILIIVSILILIYGVYCIHHTKQVNTQVEKENQELEFHNQQMQALLQEQGNFIKQLDDNIEKKQQQLNNIQLNVTQSIDNQKELSQKAFASYCEVLDNNYQQKEEEYNQHIQILQDSYATEQERILTELSKEQQELDKIRSTRAAALQAQIKEKEIKEKLAFYCLTIKQTDLDDIKVLERMKSQLHNPRILSMLIWSTYFQKPMTALCNNIIGTNIKCGIYKITNQKDNMCYIGQAVDLARRWKDHAKCGLGIDTPQNNKLYQAMIVDGLWNFSFEILEECPREELNEKERYYIQLYQSYEFGYNSNAGIK